jgi:NAD(P)-dependent dehydrogenase (short-subunit alcohol dehydrogenase family)
VPSRATSLNGRRVLITGAARGIGAATAQRLHERGARVALAGLEPELLEEVAARCGPAPWWPCDVTDRDRVEEVVAAAVTELGGLDVVVANAGVAAQMPIVEGDASVWDRTMAVNVGGVFNTLRAAGPHISHAGGYALAVSSLAAAIHLPLMGPYGASKAAVEALGDALRIELRPSGARVGVAYFAEIDTDMTSRGFGTAAAQYLTRGGALSGVAPLSSAVDAVERGIARRARRVVAPAWVAAALPPRMLVQRVAEVVVRPRVAKALRLAREEQADLTTTQP